MSESRRNAPHDSEGLELIQRTELLSDEAMHIVMLENSAPTEIEVDTSLRIKILDRCGLTCTFCHNEGTPVTVDNLGRTAVQFVDFGRSDRSSIYTRTNGVNFLSGEVNPSTTDPRLKSAVGSIGSVLEIDEVHLTGGEPTLHPDLPGLVGTLATMGMQVKVTSNGEKFDKQAQQLKDAGLAKVVFSIFGTTAEELAAVQGPRFQNTAFGERKLASLKRSIFAANEVGLKAGANIVMPDSSHEERIQRVIEEFGTVCKIRILNSLDQGEESYAAIYELLAKLQALPVKTNLTAGASGMSTDYELPSGTEIGFKKIRKSYLSVCNNCELKDNGCEEGYYGVRMYVDRDGDYRVGVCIQRMDLTVPLQEFLDGPLPNIIRQHRIDELEKFSHS